MSAAEPPVELRRPRLQRSRASRPPTPAAADIVRFELRARTARALPAFTAGAHVPVRTPAGMIRKYSLCNDPAERDRYEIAVKRDAAGRGGSVSLADTVPGRVALPVAAPRNDFALHPRAKRFLFIAGGIGITPILAMMRHLQRHRRTGRFKLYYCTRSLAQHRIPRKRSRTPALREQVASASRRRRSGAGVRPLAAAGEAPARRARLLLRPARPHGRRARHERPLGGRQRALRELRRRRRAAPRRTAPSACASRAPARALDVARRQSILLKRVRAARRATCGVPARAGTCGTCRTGLLGGEAEHRDFVLVRRGARHADHGLRARARVGAELVLDL